MHKISKIKIIICIIIVLFIVTGCLYKFNNNVRNAINSIIIFNSETNNNVPMIGIEDANINGILACGNYFVTLQQSKLTGYSTNQASFLYNIEITKPISASEGKYLLLAQQNSNKFYLYSNDKLVYEKEISGTIATVAVNKNGYVAISMNRSGYRSVIVLYNPSGEEMFTTYLATTYVANIKISSNNKIMAITEIDTSGIQIVSNIKFIKIDKVQEENSIISVANEVGKMIYSMEFASNTEVIYLTDNMVKQVNVEKESIDILDITDTNYINIDISQGEYVVRVEKKVKGVFEISSDIVCTNKNGKEVGRYTINGTIKDIFVKNGVIAANLGQEVYFITLTGRPIRKYVSNSDIKEIVMYDNSKMSALVYRNKIEIINI